MPLSTRAALNQAAVYDLGKDIRRYVSITPSGIEVFGRRGGHYFVLLSPARAKRSHRDDRGWGYEIVQ
jgi:hypothetical protein